MNKHQHRSVSVESVMTDPAPRARVTCLVDGDGSMVQVRIAKGRGHRTVTMSVSAWRYLVAKVEERIQAPSR